MKEWKKSDPVFIPNSHDFINPISLWHISYAENYAQQGFAFSGSEP